METHTSDEEDDRRHFINQNDVTQSQLPRHRSSPGNRSSFQVNSTGGRGRRAFNKRYLFAIFIPLFFLIVYFTTDIKNVFEANVYSFNYDSSVNRMREAELRALYLLKLQQLGLFNLFNHTSINNNNNNVNIINNDDLLTQISLNKEIQQVLLSSHEPAKLSNLFNNGNFTEVSASDWNRCKKVDQKFSERRTIEWNPRSDKYLFAICTSGQMSNHLICLEKHMFFAAMLNRILIIPSYKVDYEFHRVLDIDHINNCTKRKVVVTFEQFAKSKTKKDIHINKFLCYFSLPQPCFIDDEHIKKLKSLGVSMGKVEAVWVEDVKKPSNKTMQDVVQKFSSDDDVIAIGDVFFADVASEWFLQPGGPIAHECKTLVEPSRLIMLTAQRFIQTFLGENFIALHFRRHGFLKFCNAKKPSCFYPIPQAGECINRVIRHANAPVIYLSTDAAESETGLLQSLIVLNGKNVPLVKRPPRDSAEKWDALLYRHGLEGDSQVEAMLDKTISALSSVFIGSSGSTFTQDILRLRKDWGSASVCDEYLCYGEVPNFITEDET